MKYTVAQDPDAFTDGGFDLLAVRTDPAKRICEHFAIRMTPVIHPSGIDDLMLMSFTLDHVPSGRRVFGGGMGSFTEEQCAAFATSIHSTPVDWSAERPEFPDRLTDFLSDAKRMASNELVLDWESWVREDQ